MAEYVDLGVRVTPTINLVDCGYNPYAFVSFYDKYQQRMENTMKIEAGKYYKTRDGRKVGPIQPAALSDWPFKDGSGNWWTRLGYHEEYDRDTNNPDLDIISEWQDEPAIETSHGHLDDQFKAWCEGYEKGFADSEKWSDEPSITVLPDYATLAAQHGICITVKVGDVSVQYDGRTT